MTTTLEIPEDLIQRTLQVSGSPNLQTVVLELLNDYLARSDQPAMIPLLGTFGDDFYPPGELEKSREQE